MGDGRIQVVFARFRELREDCAIGVRGETDDTDGAGEGEGEGEGVGRGTTEKVAGDCDGVVGGCIV